QSLTLEPVYGYFFRITGILPAGTAKLLPVRILRIGSHPGSSCPSPRPAVSVEQALYQLRKSQGIKELGEQPWRCGRRRVYGEGVSFGRGPRKQLKCGELHVGLYLHPLVAAIGDEAAAHSSERVRNCAGSRPCRCSSL